MLEASAKTVAPPALFRLSFATTWIPGENSATVPTRVELARQFGDDCSKWLPTPCCITGEPKPSKSRVRGQTREVVPRVEFALESRSHASRTLGRGWDRGTWASALRCGGQAVARAEIVSELCALSLPQSRRARQVRPHRGHHAKPERSQAHAHYAGSRWHSCQKNQRAARARSFLAPGLQVESEAAGRNPA